MTTLRTMPLLRRALRPVWKRAIEIIGPRMDFPTYPQDVQDAVSGSTDPVRYAAIALAIERIRTEQIPGSFAEIGVFQGAVSEFIHDAMPETKLYLFDTFSGFPNSADARFKNTSAEFVRNRLGNSETVIFRIGAFPATAQELADERFSLVMFDADTYQATLHALDFFYPRLNRGGYFFLHDFNNNESNWAVSKALAEFAPRMPEQIIELPDRWGSAMFRKI